MTKEQKKKINPPNPERLFPIVLVAIIGALILGCAIFLLLHYYIAPEEEIYEIAKTTIAILGVITIGGAAVVQYRKQRVVEYQTQLDEDEKYTDRFTKAIEHLGNDSEAIRKGGLYELKRLSIDSKRDRDDIKEVVVSLIREKSYYSKDSESSYPIQDDIKHALHILSYLNTHFNNSDRVYTATLSLSDIDFKGYNFDGLNFSFTDFSNADFRKVTMSRTNLINANFRKAKLCCAELHQANLSSAILTEADLSSAFLCEAELKGAGLDHANLCDASIMNANLRDAHFIRANLCNSHFEDAILQNADFNQASLNYAFFCRADLCDASFDRATLVGARFNDANLRGADFAGCFAEPAILELFIDAKFDFNRTITNTNLTDANFTNANLTNVNFTNANLTNVNFTNANLLNANFTNANLQGAILKDVKNIERATISEEQLISTDYY